MYVINAQSEPAARTFTQKRVILLGLNILVEEFFECSKSFY
jgi:hypothetical protein